MKKFEFINTVSRAFHKTGFQIKKHSPEILVITGVVGVVASTVMACKATVKANEVVKDANKEIEEKRENTIYATPEDYKKDVAKTCVGAGVKIVKLYAPAVVVGTLSITGILASNGIMRKRNIALGAAYAAVDKGFKEYRGRVVERFGEELDKELRYNIKTKEVEETVVDENGKETTVKKFVREVDPATGRSIYAKFYDNGNLGFSDNDPETNLMFLRNAQNYANDKLRCEGYLFLNDVYDMLGIPRTKAGSIVGWIYDEKNPTGDNYVDFGIYDLHNEKARDFVNGYESVILLDFNVDGPIMGKVLEEY